MHWLAFTTFTYHEVLQNRQTAGHTVKDPAGTKVTVAEASAAGAKSDGLGLPLK